MRMLPKCLNTHRGQLAMASTQVTVENLTLIPIYAVLTWGAEHIGDVVIQAPSPDADGMYDREDFKSGSIPCEYVWYDLKVLDADRTNVSYTFLQKQVKGGTSWIFEPAPLGGYQLRAQMGNSTTISLFWLRVPQLAAEILVP